MWESFCKMIHLARPNLTSDALVSFDVKSDSVSHFLQPLTIDSQAQLASNLEAQVFALSHTTYIASLTSSAVQRTTTSASCCYAQLSSICDSVYPCLSYHMFSRLSSHLATSPQAYSPGTNHYTLDRSILIRDLPS